MQVKTNPDFKYRKIAGRHYLIPCAGAVEKSKVPVELTETAAWIWLKAEAGESEQEIAAAMTEEFDVELVTARKAVDGFLELLLEQEMAELLDG